MEVRERHLRGRHQIQIPVAGDLEEIGLELRQVARCPVSDALLIEERRLDFAIPVLARVQVEHEVDQRARQPRARRRSARKTRAGDLRARARSREMPSAAPRSQCALRDRSRSRGSPRRHTSTLSAARRAVRDACVRKVGQHQQRLVALVLDGIDRRCELPDLLRARLRLAS